jgi:SAM-dependent methyltransferase
MENINDSVIFEWDPEEFPNLLASCYYDDAIQLSLKYMTNKDARILEAGCGSGRAVKYFNDLGYNAVFGIELNADIVRTQNARHPELNILQGDILQLP